MISDEHRKSAKEALKSYSSWYGLLGAIVTVVSVCNFLFTLLHFPISLTLATLLSTYRFIVHGAFDWLMFLTPWRLLPATKDLIFLYGVIGGAFMRARMTDVRVADLDPESSVWRSIQFIMKREGYFSTDYSGRKELVKLSLRSLYRFSPAWVRRAMDCLLWPRVAKQYWALPRVYQNDYLGTFPAFQVGYTPSHNKFFIYDRRYVFAAQLLIIFSAVAAILVVNGFLSIPVPVPGK